MGLRMSLPPRRVLPLRWCSALTLVPDVLRKYLPVISATTGKNNRGLERREDSATLSFNI